MLAFATATNRFYGSRFRSVGVDLSRIDSLATYAEMIPTVGKQDFLGDQEGAPPMGVRHEHARSLREPLFVCTTSGTTGQGQEIHAQTAAEMAITGRVYSYMYHWAGLDPGDQLMLTLPITMLGGGVMEYEGAVTYGLTTYSVGNYDAARKIELIRRYNPEGLLANTSYMGRLASLITDLDVPPRPRSLITGAEGAGLAYLQRLQGLWDAPTYDRYGSTQAGGDHLFSCERGIGTSTRPGMMHNLDPYVLLEVIDPETGRQVADGEVGELVITSLYRWNTPLIRCRIGDWGLYRAASYCDCGRPFSGIEVASIFRRDDMRKVKGVQVWPKVVSDTVFEHDRVEEFRVTLETAPDGSDVARVELMLKRGESTATGPSVSAAVSDRLRARIGIGFEVFAVSFGAFEVDENKARRWNDIRGHTTR
jgi:phenylacetate-CoA ligase